MKIIIALKKIWQKRNVVLLVLIIEATIANACKTQKTLNHFFGKHAENPYVFIGSQFEPIKKIIRGSTHIGYYTDRSFDKGPLAEQFAQAQYVLTPTILDLNNIEHLYVIFDFADKKKSIKTIRNMGLIPVSISSTGIILAKNPRFK